MLLKLLINGTKHSIIMAFLVPLSGLGSIDLYYLADTKCITANRVDNSK